MRTGSGQFRTAAACGCPGRRASDGHWAVAGAKVPRPPPRRVSLQAQGTAGPPPPPRSLVQSCVRCCELPQAPSA